MFSTAYNTPFHCDDSTLDRDIAPAKFCSCEGTTVGGARRRKQRQKQNEKKRGAVFSGASLEGST
jgi:hypothetical protein